MAARILTNKQYDKYTPEQVQAVYEHAQNLALYQLANAKTTISNLTHAEAAVKAANRTKPVEEFGLITLTNANKPINNRIVSTGTINSASVYPREVLRYVIEDNAAAVLIYHNHPSNTQGPSSADDDITKKLKQVLALVDVTVIDHIITTSTSTYSYAQEGRL